MFVDHDPTHYIDISVTKDRKFLLINSSTKEDSEIWVVDRNLSDDQRAAPTNIIPRKANIRAHVDHLRDFFIMITNYGVKSKNYKITTLSDDEYNAGNYGL